MKLILIIVLTILSFLTGFQGFYMPTNFSADMCFIGWALGMLGVIWLINS